MAGINEIDLDVEAIRSSVSSVVLNINDNEGSYSGEWLTTTCISGAFKTINDILTNFESAKGSLLTHLDELDAISTEATSKVSMLEAFLSLFKSRKNNTTSPTTTATVSTQTSSLNVRKGPGVDNPVVGSASKGATITVVGKDNNGWTEVMLDDGTKGYVKTKYITINSNSPEAQSVSTTTAFDTGKTSPEEVTSIIAPTAKDTQITSSGSNMTAFVNTQKAGLNIRTGKGMDTAIKTSAAKGSTLTILEKDDGSGWTKIQTGDGTVGYVSTKFLSINNGTQNTNTNTNTNTTVNTSPTSDITAIVNTQKAGLNVRTGKGMDTAIKTSAAKGSTLTILEKDDGSGWTKVKLNNGTTGYVSSDYLSINSPNNSTSYNSTTYNGTSYNNVPYKGTAVVNTINTGLNLRSSANGSIITVIPKNTQIEIGETENGWTKVKYDGHEGYVATKWLSDIKSGE